MLFMLPMDNVKDLQIRTPYHRMIFPQTSGNHAVVVETQCPLCKQRVKNNNVTHKYRHSLSLITVEGNGNVQDKTLYHIINYVSQNMVPNFSQISTIINHSYKSIEDCVSQQST